MGKVTFWSAFGLLLLSFLLMDPISQADASHWNGAFVETEVGETVHTADGLLSVNNDGGTESAADSEPFSEKLAGFLTHPFVVPVLLSIAALGLLLGMFAPGFVPGIIGFSSLLLFYCGHMAAGLAGFWSVVLLVIGLGLLLVESFIPGGILGLSGIIAIIGSILLAGEDMQFTAISLLIALIVATSGTVILVKFFGKRLHLFKGMILTDATDTKSGYVSTANRPELVGQNAVTATALRPSGTIKLLDERIDAVSEGRFIDAGKSVKIIKVEGARIVVRELEKEGEE